MTPILVEPTAAAVDAEELTLDGLALHTTPWTVEGFEHKPAKKLLEWVRNADSDGAKLLREPRHETAEINLRLRLNQQASMDGALGYIGALVDKLQEAERLSAGGRDRGIPLVWSPAGSSFNGTFYVLAGEVDVPKETSGQDVGYLWKFPVVNATLTCSPFIYGAEVTTATTTSSLPLVTMLVADVPGDVPAEARFIVTDNAGQARDFVAIGLQNFYYDAATDLLYDSDTMVITGFAGAYGGRTGAYDPGAPGSDVIRATLSTTPVAVCSSAELAHKGTFRNFFRLWPSSTGVSVRLAWRQGRDQWTAEPWHTAPFEDAFWEVDLGQSKIRPALLGTQTWQWRIEAKSTVAGDTVDVDFHALVPSGEGYGKARRTLIFETPTVFSARDEFDQAAGNLTGKTLPIGGTWAAGGPSAVDFAVESTGKTAERTNTSGAERHALAGTATYTNVAVQVDAKSSTILSAPPISAFLGMIARRVDNNNFAVAYWEAGNAGGYSWLRVDKVVGGTVTRLATVKVPLALAATYYSTRLQVDTSGRWAVWHWPTSALSPSVLAVGHDAVFATGGALASGQVGMYDYWPSGLASSRNYDNFFAAVPTADAAIFANQSAEFRSYGDDPVLREDSTGTYWGSPAEARGGRLWLPPKGTANRTTRIAVMARRNDIEELPSENIADSTSVQVAYRPRWLAIPRQA